MDEPPTENKGILYASLSSTSIAPLHHVVPFYRINDSAPNEQISILQEPFLRKPRCVLLQGVCDAGSVSAQLRKIQKSSRHPVSTFQPMKDTQIKPIRMADGGKACAVPPQGTIFVTGNATVQDLLQRAAMVARSHAAVLITGESGTGKEVVARYIHEQSAKADQPCISVNCAALPLDVIDNELFGHEKEAFTGAVSKRPGCFELAHGGTLFLDEVAEIPPQVQAKLLRALEVKKFRRLGGNEEIEVDVRVIAATNRNIPDALAAGQLREDVYYRLGVVEIAIPPLRDRHGDVPILLRHFMDILSRRYDKPPKEFDDDSMEALSDYHWPGNVRELRNIVEALVITCPQAVVTPKCLPERITREHALRMAITVPIGSTIQAVERMLIEQTLRSTGGVKSRAAQILGVSRKYLYDRLREYGEG